MKILHLLTILLALSSPMYATYDDFFAFANNEWGYQNDKIDLKPLYNKFFEGLVPTENPFLIAIGGSPGAGKTTYRKAFLKMKNVHIHNMDEVMVELPGYQKDLHELGTKEAFEKWWPEARKIAQLFVQYAIHSSYAIIYDRTCGAEGSYFDFITAKKKGFNVKLIGLYIDESKAIARIKKREVEENRAVTENLIKEYRERFSALWPYYLKIVDEATLCQSDGKIPHIIFSSKTGILDPDLYHSFQKENNTFADYFSEKITY